MPQRTTRLELYELVWSGPVTSVASQFRISDVGLKKICARFEIPVPNRGFWAKRQAGKPTQHVSLPPRPPGMREDIIVGGNQRHWQYNHLTTQEILGPLPDPPAFSEDIADVRRRVSDSLGKVTIAKLTGPKHPVVERLLAQDEALQEKQRTGYYSWEKPVFEGKFGERRLRFLNSLFLAVARCGGKPEVSTREALRMSLKVHHATVFIKLDRATSPKTNRRGEATGKSDDALRFAICRDYDRTVETAFWQDGEAGRIEDFIKDIAIEVITSAEVGYRATCVHAFEWRVRRKAELEEAAIQNQLELERRALERQRQREQKRIDRLLDEAAALRKATDIRAYVSAVRSLVAKSEPSGHDIDQWARWALDQAARIDPVENGRYALAHEVNDEATEIYDEDADEGEAPENVVGCNEGREILDSE
jgi:hypothetical protein